MKLTNTYFYKKKFKNLFFWQTKNFFYLWALLKPNIFRIFYLFKYLHQSMDYRYKCVKQQMLAFAHMRFCFIMSPFLHWDAFVSSHAVNYAIGYVYKNLVRENSFWCIGNAYFNYTDMSKFVASKSGYTVLSGFLLHKIIALVLSWHMLNQSFGDY